MDNHWGYIAFFIFHFLYYFMQFYIYTTEVERLWQWGLITFGALLGGAISVGTDKRRFWNFVGTGSVGFWLARQVVSFVIGYYDAWVQPIDAPYPWLDVFGIVMVGATGGMVLGYRMSGWRGMLFLFFVGAASLGLAHAVTLNLMEPYCAYPTDLCIAYAARYC